MTGAEALTEVARLETAARYGVVENERRTVHNAASYAQKRERESAQKRTDAKRSPLSDIHRSQARKQDQRGERPDATR